MIDSGVPVEAVDEFDAAVEAAAARLEASTPGMPANRRVARQLVDEAIARGVVTLEEGLDLMLETPDPESLRRELEERDRADLERIGITPSRALEWQPDNSPSTTRQAESLIDKAIEEGRIPANARAQWLKAAQVVGLDALRQSLQAREPDALVAARSMEDAGDPERAGIAEHLGIDPAAVI
jgi:hypothetical protein